MSLRPISVEKLPSAAEETVDISPSFVSLMDSSNGATNHNKVLFVKNNMLSKQTMHAGKAQSGIRELEEMYYNVCSVRLKRLLLIFLF